MPRMLFSHLLVTMNYPHLVIGPGFDVAAGIPHALKKPSAPLWWERPGDGTAFRLSPSREGSGYQVSIWWADREVDLPAFPDQPFASGMSTVNVVGGVLPIHGSNGDWFPAMIGFDTPHVTYRWSIYTARTIPDIDTAPALEMLTLSFEN